MIGPRWLVESWSGGQSRGWSWGQLGSDGWSESAGWGWSWSRSWGGSGSWSESPLQFQQHVDCLTQLED